MSESELTPDHRRRVLADAAERLAHVDTPELDARRLLAAALGLEPQGLLLMSIVPDEHRALFDSYIERRAAGEPVGRILGRRGFWRHDFGLNEATLEPRPDSETLVEAALARLAPGRPARVLDLGTGTGCLLLSVLAERPLATGLGIDLAPRAVQQAQYNAFDIGLSDRAEFRAGDWVEDVAGPFDLALSNPPYIPSTDLAALMVEVRDHDPALALDGGADGLDAYRRLALDVRPVLAPGAPLLLELGAGQADDVTGLFAAAGWQVEAILPDLAGIARCLVVRA